jgi:CRISPR/Cas system CSM-associated protein Csm3 (group 7 of RAMP superfamily)
MNDRIFTARLVATAPLHPGTGQEEGSAAMTVLRDFEGRPYLPGTQVAGRLREIATRLAPALGWRACVALAEPGVADVGDAAGCECEVCQAFGTRLPGGDAPEASASSVWCFDAPLEGRCPGHAMVRHGVGIDRATGAAAGVAGALYDVEWIPAGSAFALRVEVRHGAPPLVEAVLAVALAEWQEGRGRIGGGAARGGGAFALCDAMFRRADLGAAGGVLDFLRAPRPTLRGNADPGWLDARVEAIRTGGAPLSPAAGAGPVRPGAVDSFAELSFVLRFRGAMLVGDPAAALVHGVSFAPLHAGPDWTQPVLPGSSLRGVLRAQVERIARTLAARAAAGAGDGALAAFAAAPGACDPFATRGGDPGPALASCAGLDTAAEPDASAAENAGREDAPVHPPDDCVACRLFGNTRHGSRLWIADAPLDGDPVYLLRDFLAIDRFTGGAFGGAKFDALPLYDPAFRVSLLLWQPSRADLAALAFALRDLHDGLATLGAHGSRGFGRAEVRGEVTLREGRVRGRGDWLAGGPRPGDGERWSGVFRLGEWSGTADEMVALARARGWAGAFHEACSTPRGSRAAPAVPAAWRDSYFGAGVPGLPSIEQLYPLAAGSPGGAEVGHAR